MVGFQSVELVGIGVRRSDRRAIAAEDERPGRLADCEVRDEFRVSSMTILSTPTRFWLTSIGRHMQRRAARLEDAW